MYPLTEDQAFDEEDYSQETDRGVLDWVQWCHSKDDSPHERYSRRVRQPPPLRLLHEGAREANFLYFPPPPSIFDDLVAKWQDETRYESLSYRVAMSPLSGDDWPRHGSPSSDPWPP